MIEHHLVVCPHARPVKEKVRKQALERQEFITEEIRKLEAVGLVRGVLHLTWLANPVVVRKANGKWRLCIDYTDINKACPKDPFLLLRIDQIVDSTAGCDLLSFLDDYSGYHQVFLTREDEELLGKGLLMAHWFCLLMAHYQCAISSTPLVFFTNGAPLVRH